MRATMNGLMSVESVSQKALDWASLGRFVQSQAKQAVLAHRMRVASGTETTRVDDIGLGEEFSR